MNNITDWINSELYPAIFESIDSALPELNFTRKGSRWISPQNMDGSSPKNKRKDKTVVKAQAPGWIFENGERGAVGIINYIQQRDQVGFIEAVKTLAGVVGLQLPRDNSQGDYEAYSKQARLLEDCNSYFVWCLENTTGKAAEEVRTYLASRGYGQEDIIAMELGYIPGQSQLIKWLENNKGYSNLDEALEPIKADTRIGSTHRLTIPYRSGGQIKGFKFRTVGDATPKYLNSRGLDRLGGFFNLSAIKGDKDLLIVEGELDALSATARGVENVVATGGSSINREQIADAKRRGAKSFTLCFDREPGKEAATDKNIDKAIEVILDEGVNRVYIVSLPDIGGGKTDPDRLIQEQGVETFKKAIAEAIPYYEHTLQSILNKYAKIEEERELQARDIDSLLDEVVETATRIKDPTDRDRYKKLFTSLDSVKELGITGESLSITLDRLTSTRDKEAQAQSLKRLLSQARELQDKGETGKALALLESGTKEVKATSAQELLPAPMSFIGLLDEIATVPPAYRTGYPSLDEFIGFTPGAISLIAGRPSHGKTTLLFNLLLEMSKLYPDERFYFFTYEEPLKNLSIKLINRLTATDLSGYYREYPKLPRPTNYELLKAYIRDRRTDIKAIENGKKQLQELVDSRRITLIDKNYSVEELSGLISYIVARERVGAVFIDYVQRMRTERRTQDKRTEIAHISDQVLQIAKDSGLPIILGAQLNRAAVNASNKRPSLENLKEAGNLEEDANTVISVYNDSREKLEQEEGSYSSPEREVELEITALKNREGEVNRKAPLTFDKWTGVIRDRDSSSPKQYF